MARKKKICGVYKITSPKGRCYIGSSNNIENRFSYYKTGSIRNQWLLKRSFEKYGVDNHTFEIIEECEPNDRLNRECYYGNLYKSLSDFGGLNLALPKSNDIPRCYSKETIEKLRKSKIGTKATEETKAKLSKSKIEYYKTNKHPQSKLLLNLETGIFYDTIKEAAFALNKKRPTLSMQLLGYNKNRTSLIFV